MGIQLFDLAELGEATTSGDAGLLARFDEVCRDVGAFAMTGLTLPDGLIDRVHAATLEFFSLPYEAKVGLQSADGDQFVGWKGSNNVNEFGFQDHKEMFHIGPRVDGTLAGPDADGVVPAWSDDHGVECPLWPDRLPAFRQTWHEYFRVMQENATTLGLAMAAALGVGQSAWMELIEDNWADLAANYYPPATAGSGGVRNAIHSDLTMFTILYQDAGGGGGLRMQTRAGEWLDVPPRDDVFLVNVGELLTYLTDGRWWAVPHEVSEADLSAPGADTPRISIPFFYRPNDAYTIAPLLGDAASEPLRVGEWVRNRKLLTRKAD
ncbi:MULTISPECIES: 2OG-Fe(II) oxygenase family protein [Gordonia]|uniref:2OG-Fe(II) oxygenase family protein n=1 Tax=Gordonia TaxID=2053 RepID=UPI0002E898A7|nr:MULTISPECIES: 2OG-Fe(II) oxygenase family protein [Gordonia]MDH3020525.1 2OG-Fe(II) oxygenase family protein [Gordonia alkanivorans]MDH3049396.1 2OG-Fe(II) oxygenase family protein [Gordonia alkanivorans]MDJ0007291.1 2OG-Fe(II) oxygenase family protein [Gordonia alkanivorans]MDJ0027692.1 2OG-Fe(II) oxygenase family protein [Gordonia alkanivorans]MDJ0098396.1 2OG-Fe(II) oxygenase family protein [Gordonia alkanivorans]